MLAKTEDRTPQKGGGKKRKHPGQDGERKKRAGEEGDKGDGGRKRLDALSVGYFRRVGERLSEGFEDDDERGESCFVILSVYSWEGAAENSTSAPS